jgi:hypothetical protein
MLDALTSVGPQDVDAFRRDGWTTARGVLAPTVLARLAALVDAHRRVHAGDVVTDDGVHGYGDPNSDVSRDFFLRVPGVNDLHRELGLFEIAEALLGVASARVVRDRIFIKAPGVGERTMWHQDGAFTHEAEGDLVILWIPLAIDGADGAPLRMASGSHYGPPMIESGLAWWRETIGDQFAVVEEADVEQQYRVETALASVGDVVALHGKVLHASLPNRSPSERVAYSVRFTPA